MHLKLTAMALLCSAFLVLSQGFELRCRCISMESRPIGRWIEQVTVIDSGAHCRNKEIIATLKRIGREVCLNPNLPWVISFVKRHQPQSKVIL